MRRLPVPAGPLADEVVQLRVWRPHDAAQVCKALEDPEIARWTLMPQPFTLEEAQRFIAEVPDQWKRGEGALFCINPVDDGDRVIGAMGMYWKFDAIGHLGYWVSADQRDRGVASRALRLLCRWAFDHTEIRRLELEVIPGNDASVRVAQRVGFSREGTLRSHINQRGVRHDGVMYSLLPGELSETPAG